MPMPSSFSWSFCAGSDYVHNIYLVFSIMSGVMLAVFFVVMSSLILALMCSSYRPYCLDSGWMERIWIKFSMSLILLMSIPCMLSLFEGKGPRWPFMTFFIIGHQWYWEYEIVVPSVNFLEDGGPDYEGNMMGEEVSSYQVESYGVMESSMGECRLTSSDSHLLIPEGVPYRMIFSSGDVIHNFNIKRLGLSADAVPGRLHHSMGEMSLTGIFSGWCSENCGVGHYSMPCSVEVIPFEHWMAFFEMWTWLVFL